MAIAFSCPSCDKSYTVDEKFAGRRTTCKQWKGWVTVPELPVSAEFEVIDEPVEPRPRKARVVQATELPRQAQFADDEPTPRRAQFADDHPKPKKKKKPRRDDDRRGGGISLNPAVGTGALMIVGAIVWFVLGIVLIDRIFIYPPIMLVLGVVSVIKGLMGSGE
jgi:hypothetical protein